MNKIKEVRSFYTKLRKNFQKSGIIGLFGIIAILIGYLFLKINSINIISLPSWVKILIGLVLGLSAASLKYWLVDGRIISRFLENLAIINSKNLK